MAESDIGSPERKIQPITFRQMVLNFYQERSGYRKPPAGSSFYFTSEKVVQDGPYQPYLYASVDPPMINRGGDITNLLFDVNSANYLRRPNDRDIVAGLAVRSFDVYDFDPAKLDDPTVLDDLRLISPESLLVPSNGHESQEIHSWVYDSAIRKRINEYFKSDRQYRNKYITLRKAPYVHDSYPGSDVYSYEGVKLEATKINELVRKFTPTDLAWLETFMSNKGIPIPSLK